MDFFRAISRCTPIFMEDKDMTEEEEKAMGKQLHEVSISSK